MQSWRCGDRRLQNDPLIMRACPRSIALLEINQRRSRRGWSIFGGLFFAVPMLKRLFFSPEMLCRRRAATVFSTFGCREALPAFLPNYVAALALSHDGLVVITTPAIYSRSVPRDFVDRRDCPVLHGTPAGILASKVLFSFARTQLHVTQLLSASLNSKSKSIAF